MRKVKRNDYVKCAHGTCGTKVRLDADQAEIMNTGKYIEITCAGCSKRYWVELKHGSFKTGVFAA